MCVCSVQRQNDPLVLCLRHPGAGKEYLKADSEEQMQRSVCTAFLFYLHHQFVL